NKSFSVDFSSPTSKLEIGSFLGGSLLKGTLDELAFHNAELTASEILKHFQNGANGLNYWGQDGSARTFKISASPVFEKFSTSASEKDVRLNWTFHSNMAGNFELERTSGGQGNWSNIAMVSSEGLMDFEFKDKVPTDGKFSYRIKFVSKNGGYAYSDECDVEILPGNYNLVQNYPNPFNPATTISYELPYMSSVNLTVYNTLGEKVAELVNEVQSAGSYKKIWNASHLASGIYLLRMESRDITSERGYVRTLKMIMMK
ncbi:MAG: T9SS type A sorting domain-containing protein, partial [Syntrophomonadaceae bacterium]